MFFRKVLARTIFRLAYRIQVRGLVHLPIDTKKPALLIANQSSYLDFILLDLFVPFSGSVFVNTAFHRSRFLSLLSKLSRCCFLDVHDETSLERCRQEIKRTSCLLFPEYRVSHSARLGKIEPALARLCMQPGLVLVPIHISGSERARGASAVTGIRRLLFPKITITINPEEKLPRQVAANKDSSVVAQHLFSLLEKAAFDAGNYQYNLFHALTRAAGRHGYRTLIIEDSILPKPLSYRRLILAAVTLGKKIVDSTGNNQRVGIFMPNSAAAAITFFALQAWGKTPVMLNISAGASVLRQTIQLSGIQQIITSERFIRIAELEPLSVQLARNTQLLYLEQLRNDITKKDKIRGLIASRFPMLMQRRYVSATGDEAVVLFTSGSEQQPKGVVLSASNILSNIGQSQLRFAFYRDDLVLNCLPVFHCFGLTVGTLLPLLAGVRLYMYPSPLHYDIIPRLIHNTRATFFLGTDTFYNGYARKAETSDFNTLRYAVAGAEKLRDSTRRRFVETFGIRIIEGYGATEAAPVISCNNDIYNSSGTVGRLLSDMQYRLRKVEGIDEGGVLLLQGPNIMKGYIDPKNPQILRVPGRWYNTGDIVTVDDLGFIRIVGRMKRFVKIGGEMISLQRLEQCIEQLDPNHQHAAVAIESTSRGQDLVLMTENPNLSKIEVIAHIRAAEESPLMNPKIVVYQQQIPLLASGKVNHPEAVRLIQEAQGRSK